MVDQTFKGIFESLSHMRPNSGLDILFGPKDIFIRIPYIPVIFDTLRT